MTIQKTIAALAHLAEATIQGDPQCIITGVATLSTAKEGQLAFLDNPKYRCDLATTQASAVILTAEEAKACPTNAIISPEPYYTYTKIASLFAEIPTPPPGIHPTAVIGQECHIDPSVSIGAHVVIGNHVTLGKNTKIDPGGVIGDECHIGEECHLWANVTVYYRIHIGHRVVIHSGAVVGSDGFGWAPHQGQWHKVPQLGTVIIEDDVDIGANTVIDRGTLENTVIEKGVILDNLIQIAHNVRIGAYTAIAGCVGIAGSTKIGAHCMIGGAAGISGHLEITDNVIITGMAMITHSLKEPGIYSSGTGCMKNNVWQKNVARFRKLDQTIRQLKK